MAFAHLDTLARAGLVGKQLGGNSELRPYFHVPGSARISWAPRLAALGVPATARRVGLFVGAAEPDRRWAGQRFGDLANRLQELSPVPLSFLVLAGPNEQDAADRVLAATAGTPVAKRVVRAPTPDLLQLAAALQDCDVAICNDTGPLHLSVAVGTPSCGIYRRPLPHFLVPAPHRCVVASERQIDAIRVEEVLAAAGPLLEDAARVPERRSSLR